MELRTPKPLRPGDRVAVMSPSWSAPAEFPTMHEQAVQRIRDELGLEPVETSTTRRVSTPQERAADLNAAFADPSIRAILATIGGDDQITVLPHLDPTTLAEPTWFGGLSDNTNLLNWLWFHGVASIHGVSTQMHLGPGPAVHQGHLASLRAALFGGDLELTPMPSTRDWGVPWEDPRALTEAAPELPAESWTWTGAAETVTGTTWGGCLEIVDWTLATNRFVHPPATYQGCVFILEISEERPSPQQVFWMLRNLGERGILGGAAAVVWGRPMAADRHETLTAEEAGLRRASYREHVMRAIDTYCPGVPVVLDVDLGHTCPQWVTPYGGRLTVDGAAQRLVAHYGPTA